MLDKPQFFYAGIGSRDTPRDVLSRINKLAQRLALLGFTLRSGGAKGADLAFENGSIKNNGNEEIYLPYQYFNHNPSDLYEITPQALSLAEKYHPNWSSVTEKNRNYHARNSYQVLGFNLDSPSLFIACWTEDGCEQQSQRTIKTGGTGQAISIANDYGIPVFNLRNPDALSRMADFLKSKGLVANS